MTTPFVGNCQVNTISIQPVKVFRLLHVADMAAFLDDGQPAVGVACHLLANRGEEHMIFLPIT